MSRAVCARCGQDRANYRDVCPSCGFRPDGEAVKVAWLLSSEHYDGASLDRAAERIKKGEPLRPTEAMYAKAARALGEDIDTDAGLTTPQRLALLVLSIFVTPLPAYVIAAWNWGQRPRVAVQALALALASSVTFVTFWLWAVFG